MLDSDRLYLDLKGSRERLCRAQTGMDKENSARLGRAIIQVDLVGSDLCREQWSEHDLPGLDLPEP